MKTIMRMNLQSAAETKEAVFPICPDRTSRRNRKPVPIRDRKDSLVYWSHRARWLKWLECEFTDRKFMVRTRRLSLDFPCLDLGNLAVSQPSCFLRVAWQLGTRRVLQLNDFLLQPQYIYGCLCFDFTTDVETMLTSRNTLICKPIWFCERLT
ncbi:hypothetical protein CSKR_113318 [Clonorchis sinensis]|uniref:Uncharacterized protein n=1 Tax=Clonorchis sinensis TaxID=79923 RepID=A0A419PYP5_CLOSI|nr:hypothetical protein CSKR_113318 [Clonorchis sinensis]